MAWLTPKTDWEVSHDSQGQYNGDRFNAEDFNRINNNLSHLRDMVALLYGDNIAIVLLPTKTYEDFFYADEMNRFIGNLNIINSQSLHRSYGAFPIYEENERTPLYTELNQLEGAILDLYDRLSNELEGRRTLTWNFGMRGGDL